MVCSVYEAAEALPAPEFGAGPSSDRDGAYSERPEARSERAHERRGRVPDRPGRPGRPEAPDAQSGGHGGIHVGPVHRIRYADDLTARRRLRPSAPHPVPRVPCHRLGVREACRGTAGRPGPARLLQPILPARRGRELSLPVESGRASAAERLGTGIEHLWPVRLSRESRRQGLPRLRSGSPHARVPARFGGFEGRRQAHAAAAQPELSVLRSAGSPHHRGCTGVEPAQHRTRPVVRLAPQRRSQGHRLLGQRAGRRTPGLVLRGANVAQRTAGGHRPGDREERRHCPRRPAGSDAGLVESDGREPRRVRRGTLHQRVHRAGSAVVSGLRGVARQRRGAGGVQTAFMDTASSALGHARRADVRRRRRADPGTHACRLGGRGPGSAGAGLRDRAASHSRGFRRAAGDRRAVRAQSGARGPAPDEGAGCRRESDVRRLPPKRRQPVRHPRRRVAGLRATFLLAGVSRASGGQARRGSPGRDPQIPGTSSGSRRCSRP